MFKRLKLQLAAQRVKKENRRAQITQSEHKFGHGICAPFRMIGRGFSAFWGWVRNIDLIGLFNLTLLLAIIVLFAILIMNFISCNKSSQVTLTNIPHITAPTPVAKSAVITVPAKAVIDTKTMEAVIRLPLKKIIPQKPEIQSQKLYGDIVIDGQLPGDKLSHYATINGNLYVQNMRRYTLPCGIRITGDLYIRDIEMLRFCGDFTIIGNIYVNRRSSFGPVPKTAHLGGQIIF